jgi:hypothetical protein
MNGVTMTKTPLRALILTVSGAAIFAASELSGTPKTPSVFDYYVSLPTTWVCGMIENQGLTPGLQLSDIELQSLARASRIHCTIHKYVHDRAQHVTTN